MSNDVIYFNVSIGNNDVSNAGNPYNYTVKNTTINCKLNSPIIEKPDEYYCSIIRMQISGMALPVAFFQVQTPVTDINRGICSFTLSYNGFNSQQIFLNYTPQISDITITPPAGTQKQTYSSYYFIYDYTTLVDMWNNALITATTSLNTVSGSTFTAPFFQYDAKTQLISLYTNASNLWHSSGGPEIWCNFHLNKYFVGLPTKNYKFNSDPFGKDVQINVINVNQVNLAILRNTPASVYTTNVWIQNSFDFSGYGYYNLMKSIIVTTQMNVDSEIYFINNSETLQQNTSSVNLLTDFLPDLSGTGSAGASSQIFIYNASSLYRVFTFNQSTPLREISLNVSILDVYDNIYPILLDMGISCSFKLMFIKKSLYNTQNLKLLKNNI